MKDDFASASPFKLNLSGETEKNGIKAVLQKRNNTPRKSSKSLRSRTETPEPHARSQTSQ